MSRSARRWLLDLGNSRLKCSELGERDVRGAMAAFDLQAPQAMEEFRAHLGSVAPGDVAWLASVAPAAVAEAVRGTLRAAGVDLREVRTQARCSKLRIAYAEPAQLGVDRFLGLLAASERTDGPWVLVSAGSAMTLDLLQADGEHVGGLIAAMPRHMRAALAQRFQQLDVEAGAIVDFATSTADAVASGVHAAALGLVERSLGQAQRRLQARPTLLISGGDAALFGALDHPATIVLPTLVLDGLAIYAREVG